MVRSLDFFVIAIHFTLFLAISHIHQAPSVQIFFLTSRPWIAVGGKFPDYQQKGFIFRRKPLSGAACGPGAF